MQLGMALPIILGNVMLFISVPILAERYERHSTFAGMELAIMLKLTFFQVFNTTVAAAAFRYDPIVASHPRQWYTLGGALLANVMLGDAIFIQVLLDFVQIPVLINRLFIAPRATTQKAMDQAYAVPAGIYLAFRLQLAGKFVVLCTMFGSAIPVLYAIAAFYFWLAGWIDRYNLLRRLAPPPVTDASLTAAVSIVVFPLSILLHALMALVFFSGLADDDQHANGVSPLAAAATTATTATTATLAVNASVGGGGIAPLASLPVAIALGTTEGWNAYHIQLVTTAVALGCLAFFAVREIARHLGIRLRLLTDAQTNVVLKVITQEPDEAQQAALVGATAPLAAHSNHIYLPPLPPILLHELGHNDRARKLAVQSVDEVTNAANLAAELNAMDDFVPGGNAAGGRVSFRSRPPAGLVAESNLSRRQSGLASGPADRHSAPSSADEPMHIARAVTLDRAASFGQQARNRWQEHERRFSERFSFSGRAQSPSRRESNLGAMASPARACAQPHCTTPSSSSTPVIRHSARAMATVEGSPASSQDELTTRV